MFQPTLPVRGATYGTEDPQPPTAVSTHAPREGSDAHERRQGLHIFVSTHAPREGSDLRRPMRSFRSSSFQPTLPVRGATDDEADGSALVPFQPTLPVRGATADATFGANWSPVSTHAPREGSDSIIRSCTEHSYVFQPTLPVRGATWIRSLIEVHHLVSTHAPREGSDAPRQ